MSTSKKNIFIAAKNAARRKELFSSLQRKYKTNIRIWTYPLYLVTGALFGFSIGGLSHYLPQIVIGIGFFIANAVFFEIVRLRKRLEIINELLVIMEEDIINIEINKIPERKVLNP